jgi:hypothetical protein
MDKPTIGIWVDDPANLIRTPKYWDAAKEHGIECAALMMESIKEGFDPKYTADTLETVFALAEERDIELALTCWFDPSLKYIAQFEEKIGALLAASGAVELENDAEANWKPARLEGFPDMARAAKAATESLKRVQEKYDVRTALTTFPGHRELGDSAQLSGEVDRVFGQAYSVRHRTTGNIAWDSRYGPGGMQKYTLERTLTIPGVGTSSGPLVCVGLAAYDQTFPGHTPQEAMQVAYDMACKYSPVEIRYWSSKWVFGIKKNDYASKFLKKLAKGQ